MNEPGAERAWVPLDARERRVMGVLVEKAKTTPEYYPMTLAGLVTGCNQKSNRDPITNFDQDDIEDILLALRKKGAVIMVEAGGRVVRWKHTLYDWLKVSKVELAIIAELLLRGSQTEGDLRARASRMEPLADLQTLQTHLEALATRHLVITLSPPGQKRGVMVTHGLYLPKELEREQAKHGQGTPDEDEPPIRSTVTSQGGAGRAEASAALAEQVVQLKADVETLKVQVDGLANELRELKTALGV